MGFCVFLDGQWGFTDAFPRFLPLGQRPYEAEGGGLSSGALRGALELRSWQSRSARSLQPLYEVAR